MKMKEFKTESKKLMDLMINSIYTNKEIFLREIISNASDAIDKLHYKSLTDSNIKVNKDEFKINISIDKDKRLLTISDNGIGMSKEELENNLGTIAKSGSEDFKANNEHKEDIDIIGQFGVGFYSAFMVSSKVEVISRAYGSEEANMWVSEGVDGYSISKCDKDSYGTDIILTIKSGEEYNEYLDNYKIQELIRKYSDYITVPINMDVEHRHLKEKKNESDKDEYETVIENQTINSLVPLWKRNKSKISEEEYNTFYSDKFFDYETPLLHIHTMAEGSVNYNSLLYVPSHAPYDFYTKDYEKGLQLYSNGVLIMEKCGELLPDYFSFVKGIVDSPDLSLNISRETLQQDKVLKTIAKSIESKIRKELEVMRDEKREDYEKFINAFGAQLKYGIYANYGMDKDKLQDLVMFYSSNDGKYTTLKEYVSRKGEEQKNIYYAAGESISKIENSPKVSSFKDKYEILYCIENVDEFALKVINEYEGLKLVNVNSEDIHEEDSEKQEEVNKINDEYKDMFNLMKEAVTELKDIKFTTDLKNHPVCLSSSGEISLEMEKTLSHMPNSEFIKAEKVLLVNSNHKIADKLKELYNSDKDKLKDYTKVLYAMSRLMEGLSIDNPLEISNLVCEYLDK